MAINVTRWSICLLVLLSILPSVFGLYFYLEGSEQKCFTEELPKETMVIGKPTTRLVLAGRARLTFPTVKLAFSTRQQNQQQQQLDER